MKTAVIFSDGIKQIILTPENEDEKFALSLISSKDEIELAIVDSARFGNEGPKPFTANVAYCRANYLRVFDDSVSKVLVLKPRTNIRDLFVDLLKRASGLIGNPGMNISASTDLAAEQWQKDYNSFFTQPSPDNNQ
jgi:hypothetical protein